MQVSDEYVAATYQAYQLAADVLQRLLAVQREVFFLCVRVIEVKGFLGGRKNNTSFAERMCRLRDAGHQAVKRKPVIHCPLCAKSFNS